METLSYDTQEKLLTYYKSKRDPKKIVKNINKLVGEDVMDLESVYLWFRHFKAGNLSLESVPLSSSEIIDLTFWPSNEFLFDILKFLSRNEVEKCILINKTFKTFITENAEFLPYRIIERLVVYFPEMRIDLYPTIQGDGAHHYFFGNNNFELKYLASSLKYCVLNELRLSRVSSEHEGQKMMEMFKNLRSFMGQNLKVNTIQEFNCISPFYEKVFTTYLISDIINLDVSSYPELLKLFININKIQLPKTTKKVFIRCSNYQPYAVDILPQLLNSINNPKPFYLMLYRIDDIEILNYLIDGIIQNFEESENPNKLLSEIMFMWTKTNQQGYASLLHQMNEKGIILEDLEPMALKLKKRTQKLDQEQLDLYIEAYKEVQGRVETDNDWFLNIKIDAAKYVYGNKIYSDKISCNIYIKIKKSLKGTQEVGKMKNDSLRSSTDSGFENLGG